mgnify:CR=1 FL=1
MNMIGGLFGILMALTIWAGMIALFFLYLHTV